MTRPTMTVLNNNAAVAVLELSPGKVQMQQSVRTQGSKPSKSQRI